MNVKNNDICGMKKHIAVVMGGTTSEHSISIKSGTVVMRHLPEDLFEATAVVLSGDGWLAHYNNQHIRINQDTFTFNYEGKVRSFDAVFNAVHGAPGENGELQQLLEKLQIPFTGCSAEVARLTYNKYETLEFLKPRGVHMAAHLFIQKGTDWNTKKIVDKLGLPCFVKANRAGSSFGVVKVHRLEEMQDAIATAMKEDDEVLIEQFLAGTEVSIGVIEYNGAVLVLPPTEIITETDFFDYTAKYEGKSKEITPARLNKKQLENLRVAAKKVFVSLGARGFSRSDFIFQGDKPYFLELNSIPGLTEQSLLPQQARKAGISLTDLFTDMLHSCIKNNTFDS